MYWCFVFHVNHREPALPLLVHMVHTAQGLAVPDVCFSTAAGVLARILCLREMQIPGGVLFQASQLLMLWWKLRCRPSSEWLSVAERFWGASEVGLFGVPDWHPRPRLPGRVGCRGSQARGRSKSQLSCLLPGVHALDLGPGEQGWATWTSFSLLAGSRPDCVVQGALEAQGHLGLLHKADRPLGELRWRMTEPQP